MSLFNLERFRYQKEKKAGNVPSISSPKPEQRRAATLCSSDKENYLGEGYRGGEGGSGQKSAPHT